MGAVAKDRCKHGHALNDRTTYIETDGFRRCRACRNRIQKQNRDRRVKIADVMHEVNG
jgi:hypothetical protein